MGEGLPIYELLDDGNDPLKGNFYEQELQAVTLNPDQHSYENVLTTLLRSCLGYMLPNK